MTECLTHSQVETPVGVMDILATNKGICHLSFDVITDFQDVIEEYMKEFDLKVQIGENRHTLELKKQLNEYFNFNREIFSVPLILIGTEFQKKVWNYLRTIPYATTISYKEQSIELKDEKAIRAIAKANGANPIAIIIPCHRVIGTNGKLTGYAGGIERKRFLLNLEGHKNKKIDLFNN